MRAGEVIAKLAEDVYFMRVDNRVTQVPPVKNRQQDNETTSRSGADNSRNRTRGELLANPNRTWASAGGPSHSGNSAGGAGGNREIIPHRDPGGGGNDGGSSNHGAGRRAGGGGDRKQPRLQRFMWWLRRPPKNRRTTTQEVLHGGRQRRLPHLLCTASQSTSLGEIQTSRDHQV
jgi:hypothetical protein